MLTVFVSGLPFQLQGWNKDHTWSNKDSCYISYAYRLYPILLYGIPIYSTRIRNDYNDGWIFEVFNPNGSSFWRNCWIKRGLKNMSKSKEPFGYWTLDNTYEFEVSNKCKTWIK